MKRIIIVTVWLCLIGVGYCYAQTSSPSATFIVDEATDPNRNIGLPFHIILEVTLPQSSSVTQVQVPLEWEWLTLQTLAPDETVLLDGFKKETWELSVISWESGSLSTPKATLIVQDQIGNFEEILISPAFFEVASIWDGGESLKPAIPMAKISLQPYYLVLVGSLACMLLLGLGWRAFYVARLEGGYSSFLRLRSKPSKEFLRRLKNIAVTALTIEEQANQIDEASRHYIQQRFNLKTKLSHLTHAEFQRLVQDDLNLNANSESEFQALYAVLSAIKYSPMGVVITDSSTLPNLAKSWLKSVDLGEDVK